MRTKKGLTLTEVIVAIAIVMVGITGFVELFARSWRSNSFIIEQGEASRIASRAVSGTTADLRRIRQADNGAYPIETGNEFELVAFLDIDGDTVTERVRYFLENGEYKRSWVKPAGTPPVYPEAYATTEILARFVVNEAAQPIFYYYNSDYPGDAVNNPLATPVDIENVRLVKVHLRINIDPVNAPNNVNIESFAELRNINDYLN